MKELKEDKEKLEKELFKIIRDFEEKYEVEVYDIYVSHERIIGEKDTSLTSIDIDVRV